MRKYGLLGAGAIAVATSLLWASPAVAAAPDLWKSMIRSVFCPYRGQNPNYK
jgi:hypothetical protein